MNFVEDEVIIASWNEGNSIYAISMKYSISWNKVVKALSSNNILINDTHKNILNLYIRNFSVSQIAMSLNISENTVKAYIPRTKGKYKTENCTKKAEYSRKWRDRQVLDK